MLTVDSCGHIQGSYVAPCYHIMLTRGHWLYPRKLCCPMLTHYVDRLCWHRLQLVATSKEVKLCCPMLPHYVDMICWQRMQLVAISKAGWKEDKGWCWDNKMRLEVARSLTLPQCQPSIIIKIRPRTFISCIAAEKIHYNVIIIQIMCASLPTFCCRNTTENLKVNVDWHKPGCMHAMLAQLLWTNWSLHLLDIIYESHVWLQIYLSTKAIVFFPILNNL